MPRRFVSRCVAALRGTVVERSAGISRLRLETRAAILGFRRARRTDTRHLRLRLREHRAAIASSWREAVPDERRQARARVEPPAHPACAGLWELRAGAPDPQPASPAALRNDVVRVIARHPDGIVARDVGNELGVDWRRVAALTPELLDAGAIERIGERLYPSPGTASGR